MEKKNMTLYELFQYHNDDPKTREKAPLKCLFVKYKGVSRFLGRENMN